MHISEEQLRSLSRDAVTALPTVEHKLAYFEAIQVGHRELENTARQIIELSHMNNGTDITGVVGPTGIGKTRLLKLLFKGHIDNYYSDPEQDKSSVPYIYLSIRANGDKSLSWATVYETIMLNGGEILLDKKHVRIVKDGCLSVVPKRYKTLAAMRGALESMLRHRKVKYIAIDEAFHLLRFGNYSATMDTLKSIVDETPVKIILAGTYDIFDLVTNYGQSVRRGEVVHFKRYHRDKSKDAKEFKTIISKLQAHWPFKDIPAFDRISDELMEASLGCTGLLKGIMLRALTMQHQNNERWNPIFLAKAAKSLSAINKISSEITEGEKKVQGGTYGESIFSGRYLEKAINKMNLVKSRI